jgi:beta-galactosidase
VEAVDSGGDVSPLSAAAAGTTLALPSAPVNLSGTAVSNAKVTLTWAASTGTLPIATYKVYRGASPSDLATAVSQKNWFASVKVPKTSYTDVAVTPDTTFYYTVEAVDSAMDYSAAPAAATVTTPN